jgi:hypothetical protein
MAYKIEQLDRNAKAPAARRHAKRMATRKRRATAKRLMEDTPPSNRYEGWAS